MALGHLADCKLTESTFWMKICRQNRCNKYIFDWIAMLKLRLHLVILKIYYQSLQPTLLGFRIIQLTHLKNLIFQNYRAILNNFHE